MSQRDEFEIDNEYLLQRNKDSKLLAVIEETFFLKWIKENLGKMPTLVCSASEPRKTFRDKWNRREGSRRVDFIFYHPKIDAIAIEIDGGEHEANEAVDLERDNLRSVGIDVIRIKMMRLIQVQDRT